MRENRNRTDGTTMETEAATTAVPLSRAHGCGVSRPDSPARTKHKVG